MYQDMLYWSRRLSVLLLLTHNHFHQQVVVSNSFPHLLISLLILPDEMVKNEKI